MRGGARHTSQASQEAAARSDTFSLAVALTVGEEGESEPIRTDFDQATLQHEPYPHRYPSPSSPLTLSLTLSLILPLTQPLALQATLRLLEAFNMELSLPPGGARSAIHVLASATSLETESLHLRVWRGAAGDHGAAGGAGGGHKSRLVGEVWLPLTKVYTPGDHAEVDQVRAYRYP